MANVTKKTNGAIGCACCNTPKSLKKRLKEIEKEEAGQPESWWWVQFGPTGTDEFLGACIVRARSWLGAIRESHRQGCNPGGIVVAYELPTTLKVEEEWTNFLFDEDDIEAFEDSHQPEELAN